MMTRPTPRRCLVSPVRSLAAAIAACAVLIASGCSSSNPPADDAARLPPADDSAEAGFARDMATHHAQAVEMAFIIRDKTTDSRLRSLADDIIVTQSAQRGMFMAWLQLWELPQAAAGARMAWMMPATGADNHAAVPHDHGGGDAFGADGLPAMAGMASTGEMDELRAARGREAEVQFLRLMIRHHEGGVLMARAVLERSTHQAVVTLARGVEDGQTGEIESMQEMLAERDAQPLPSLFG